jgi:hypothetical protein
MSIESLQKILPPPVEPYEAFDGPWEAVEAELGTRLPQDYKDFVRIYGSGYFMEFLGIDVPRSSNPNVRLELNARLVGDSFRTLYDDDEYAPHWFWPERKGLLPFGGTDNGDYLFWHMVGEPDDWKVVIWDRGGDYMDEFQSFDFGLVDFLVGLASGVLLPKAFPDSFELGEPLFEANTPHPASEADP